MCHWLCTAGTHHRCFFEAGDLGSGGRALDVSDELWDELDDLHEHLRRSPGNRDAATDLGNRITFALRDAMRVSPQVGQSRRAQLEARYGGEPDPRAALPPLRVVVRAEQDVATAAAEIRKLGDAFATALGDALRSGILPRG